MLVAATDALIAAAARGGLVIVLEDLHWADETSLRLLGHVAGELRRSHLLVLGTHRPPLRGSRLDAALPDLLRAAGGEALSLPPLAAAEVAQLLGATTGIDVGTPAAEATTARTGGNCRCWSSGRALAAGRPGRRPALAAHRCAAGRPAAPAGLGADRAAGNGAGCGDRGRGAG